MFIPLKRPTELNSNASYMLAIPFERLTISSRREGGGAKHSPGNRARVNTLNVAKSSI